MGIGDYALFIVTRYREGLHAPPRREATITAMDTAGRAVIFAGVTVVVSLLGLLLIGIGWVGGLGIGVAVTVLVTMITSITLLPALLGFARERVEVTRWRGLVVAGFVAVALLGIGIGVPALSAVGAGLAAVTLLVSFAVRSPDVRTGVEAVRDPRYRWSRRSSAAVSGGRRRHGFLLALARRSRLRLGTPTRAPARTLTHPPATRPRQLGPGSTVRSMITVVPVRRQRPALYTLQALAETPGVATVTAAFPTFRPPAAYLLNHVPTTAPQDAATTNSSRRCATMSSPRRSPAHRSTSRSPGRPPPTSTSPTSSPNARSSSSPPCWRCRSCS